MRDIGGYLARCLTNPYATEPPSHWRALRRTRLAQVEDAVMWENWQNLAKKMMIDTVGEILTLKVKRMDCREHRASTLVDSQVDLRPHHPA